ncbi:MAG: hypothetical protein WA874_09250 [Chryseosolibacter sp.]
MKNWPTLLLFLLTPLCMEAQQHSLDTLVQRFTRHREGALQEKIYAHIDRSFYLTGETLWFKIYTVDGSFHKPLDVSKVAYAEVLDKGNFPVLQAKIELNKGMGSGSFFLPASLNSGNYRLRLYTNWMKNSDPDFYFDEAFTIVNPFVVPPANGKITGSHSIHFFPEGGNLVSGLKSKIAFKITDENGLGADGKGFLLNSEGDTASILSGTRFGIGNFVFTPSDNETYKAILIDKAGRKSSHAFPSVFPAGYVMHVRDSGEYLTINIQTKGVDDAHVFLFAHARQQITVAERQHLQHSRATFRLKKSDLQGGISHFTLFDENLQPVCERLYFTYPNKNLNIDVASNAKVYNIRSKVSLSLQTRTDAQAPVPANLSLSVYRIDSLGNYLATDIHPYLWLTSDLTGEVESPEYYFSKKAPAVVAAMDNLMLTHGWRRFSWQHILDGNQSVRFLPEVNSHIIRGLVSQGGKKQRAIFTYLGSPGKIIRAYGSWSNADGEVKFEIKDFYGPRRIIIQTKADSTQTYDLKIENPFSNATDKDRLPPLQLDAKVKEDLLSRSIAMQVQDIYYDEAYGNRFETPMVDSSAFYGEADNAYYLDDYTRFPVMEEVMREYVPGVFVRKRRDGFHFMVIDNVNGGVLSGDPMVLVDGVPVFDVDDIMKIDPLRVEKLEVVKRLYYLGQAVFSGIASYSTYKGDLGGLELDARSLSLDYDGLQLKREFFSPHYNTNISNDRMPDQRYLLHWAPEITTGEDGKQTAQFYTSDVPGLYKVVVHGLNGDGLSGSKSFTFTVKASDNQ